MKYKKNDKTIQLYHITEEPSFEPTESYNNSFTFIPSFYPSYYQTISPYMIYITSQDNHYTEVILIVVFSSLASVLFILFILWYKYNRKKNSTKSFSIKSNSKETLDDNFGTLFILDDI
jgi:hypothetical protein